MKKQKKNRKKQKKIHEKTKTNFIISIVFWVLPSRRISFFVSDQVWTPLCQRWLSAASPCFCLDFQINLNFVYWGCPINFELECIVRHSSIWQTYMVYIRVEWFKMSRKSMGQLYTLNSVWGTAHIVSLVAHPCQRLSVSLDGGRRNMGEQYTCNNNILRKRGMFSALFNARTIVLWWIVWFLPTGKKKKMVCVGQSVVRIAKKWIWKPSNMFALNLTFGLEKTSEETIAFLKKTFGYKCLSNSSIKKWHKEFKDGRKSVYDTLLCGNKIQNQSVNLNFGITMYYCHIVTVNFILIVSISLVNNLLSRAITFSFENCDRGQWSKLYTTSHILYSIHHRELVSDCR